MRLPLSVIFIILMLLAEVPLRAQYRFVENGTQWPQQVHFRADIPGGRLYFESGNLLFDLYDAETTSRVFAAHSGHASPLPVPASLQCHAYRLRFAGANPNTQPLGKQAFETAYNFFLGSDPSKWSGGLSAYAEVLYPELYPGIDLKVYSKGALKYDFVVKPGADPSRIRLVYDGVKPKITKEGQLLLKTAVGEVIESKPFAYQIIGGKPVPVACSYAVSGKEVTFTLGSYDASIGLVIDPELIFSTYSGSTADNFGYTATYDAQGHLYAGGSVFGAGYPTTTGAYQASWAGGVGAGALIGTDIGLTKFTLDGTGLVYSTYLGGAGDELPHSLVTDEAGNLYMLGTTGSANYPVTPGAFQPAFAGGQATVLGGVGIAYNNGCDMVVTRLNPGGNSLGGSTFVGGSENDGVNTAQGLRFNYADEMRGEIEIDHNGNIVVGSSTYSTNFPMAGGGFQNTKNDLQEGVVFVMNSTLTSMSASTFYGGSGHDAIYSIDTGQGKVTVGGGTRSTNLPVAGTPFQASNAGGVADGFVAVFNSGLSTLETMTYFGSAAYDQVYFVERDAAGNPHIFGQTTATGETMIANAPYSVPNSGMLLAKFSPNLSTRTWSTVFGNGINVPNISPSAFSVDICNRVYLSGWGGSVNTQGSTSGLPVTPDALQTTTDGSDFYFFVLEGDASAVTFASFFGGGTSAEHVDGGTSRFDRTGKIYQAVCAGCGSNDDFPIFPPNAHSPTNNSFNCNLGVAKIDFNLPLVIADFAVQTACLPQPVVFTNNSVSGSVGTAYLWDFGDGSNSNLANPSHVYNAPGTYTASLVVWDPLACNLSDTLEVTFEVFPEVVLDVETDIFSCTETTFTIEAGTNGAATLYTWATDPAFQNVLLQGPTASILTFTTTTPTTIYIQATAGPCTASQSIQITPPPIAQLSIGDTLLCSVQELTITLTTSGSPSFSNLNWEPEDLVISGLGTAQAVFAAEAPFTVSVTAEAENGCIATAQAEVLVYPISLTVPADTLACFDDPLLLTANANGLAQTFEWSANANFGTLLNTDGDSAITVVPAQYMYYYVRVVNELCSLVDSVGVGSLKAGTFIQPDLLVCAGDTVTVMVTNDFPFVVLQHQWEPADLIFVGQGTNIVYAVVNEPTTFTVVSTTSDGLCSTENQTTVFTSPLGELSFTATASPSIITAGASSTLSVVPAIDEYQYLWSPETALSTTLGTQVTSTPAGTITYTVSVIDQGEFGACVRKADVTLTVADFICGEPFIFVPNAFSPNSDGENDVLFVRGQNIANLEFSIYDRWGERVFYTTDQSLGWDGTHLGKAAAPAVFVYHLEVDCGDGQSHFQKGNITLLR